MYNEASDVVTFTDENGSVFSNTFDAIGHKTLCSITKAAGVIGTDSQSFEFDGLSRMTFCRDTIASTNADVKLFYDSLSRVVEDAQILGGNTRNATNIIFGSYPVTLFAFPNDRLVANDFDLLYRRTRVGESAGGALIGRWEFFGPSRVAELELGNGLICTHLNNARTHSAVQQSVSNPSWGDQSSDRLAAAEK